MAPLKGLACLLHPPILPHGHTIIGNRNQKHSSSSEKTVVMDTQILVSGDASGCHWPGRPSLSARTYSDDSDRPGARQGERESDIPHAHTKLV
jgi:hypothetical protein